jgi:outer membrane lipoprotein-sorting protein
MVCIVVSFGCQVRSRTALGAFTVEQRLNRSTQLRRGKEHAGPAIVPDHDNAPPFIALQSRGAHGVVMRNLILPALIIATGLATAAGATSLDDVAVSLKATTSLSADFTQTGADGKVLTGQMILARPGKIRFQYDKAKLLIVGNGRTLTFVDYAVNQVSQWPVKSTPLGILLASDPNLSFVARIAEVTEAGVIVVARDPKRPEFGSLAISFRSNASAPGGLALAGWTSFDAQGGRTTTQLSNIRYNADLSKADFGFRDPRRPVTRGG